MGYTYAFDAGASNGYNSMVGGYNPENENRDGPQVGLQFLLGDWLIDYDEQISEDGIFSWNEIPNAASYRVYAFRYGERFPVNTPANLRQVWTGGFNETANASAVEELTAHTVASSVGIEAFHITNNTHLMSRLAAAYANTTETEFDLNTMGLEPGKYVFRVQALAPENQPPPVASPPLKDLPFANALVSGFLIEDSRSLNIVTGTAFPSFVIEGAEQEAVVTTEVATIVRDGVHFAPIRYVAETLGASVSWNQATSEVTIVRGDGRTVTFTVGQAAPGMEAASWILDGRTIVPVNFIVEFFGDSVTFDAGARLIGIMK